MSTNNNQTTDEGKPKLSNEQKQKMKKYAVFALMGVIFLCCMWFIFSPSAKDKAKQEQQTGFNADIPMPKNESIIGDKRDAYEQEQMKQRQEERMRSLDDFSSLLEETSKKQTAKPSGDLALFPDEPSSPVKTGKGTTSSKPASVHNSMNAYHDINRTLGSFYEKPREDPEKEQLKQELDELKNRMNETDNRKRAMDEQLALMEKSFQMAAKYIPGAAGTPSANVSEASKNSSGKTLVAPVTQVREQTVSALLPEMSGADFISAFSQPRNTGFLTATSEPDVINKNTISACIHGNQTVMNGESVRLRLLEAIHAGGQYIPQGTLLSGIAKIQSERLQITIHSLENAGTIQLVSLTIYDLDGQQGISIPKIQELDAAKEILANMGTTAGTSINLSTDATEQFIADVGRNLIQGVSQYTAKKLREVKVHLKSGYRVYLISEGSLNTGKQQPRMANNNNNK